MVVSHAGNITEYNPFTLANIPQELLLGLLNEYSDGLLPSKLKEVIVAPKKAPSPIEIVLAVGNLRLPIFVWRNANCPIRVSERGQVSVFWLLGAWRDEHPSNADSSIVVSVSGRITVARFCLLYTSDAADE